MADIEFVIEAPQVTRTSKKRPRLVTSCDHCRVKKIKCVQRPASAKCEACLSANLPCLYRDREQYFAERTRMLSGASSALRDASAHAQGRAQLSAINASTPSPSRGPTPPKSSNSSGSTSTTPDRSNSPWLQSYFGTPLSTAGGHSHPSCHTGYSLEKVYPTWDRPAESLSWTPCPSPDMHADLDTGMMGISQSLPQFSPLFGLFDAADSTQPHPNLMMNFIQVFFDKLGPTYPFLSSAIIVERFLSRRLPALLANAIAASAARLSALVEIAQIGPANVADVYCQMAKSLVPPDGTAVTVDTLHAVMLLAWAEQKRGRHTMFSAYARTATRLAAELGISDDALAQLTRVSDPHGACILGATWQGVQMLERTLLAAELVALSNPNPQSLQQHQVASSAISSQATGTHGHNRSGVPSLW
ncbi:hypothetical protein C8Q74DRAFT_1197418 [Fomes fomentarius]|nr:hypothetical protein C8Q74DRAFT_1197418 [Fomes fomentarius]